MTPAPAALRVGILTAALAVAVFALHALGNALEAGL